MNRPAHVSEWDNMIVVDLNLKATDHPQLIKLNAMLKAAWRAQKQARRGLGFASYEGLDLARAALDFFEDDLATVCDNIAHELGEDREMPVLHPIRGYAREIDPSAWEREGE